MGINPGGWGDIYIYNPRGIVHRIITLKIHPHPLYSQVTLNKNSFSIISIVSPEDHQSILIETSSCNLQFFSELISQLRDFHMVSPQVVFTLLNNLYTNYLFLFQIFSRKLLHSKKLPGQIWPGKGPIGQTHFWSVVAERSSLPDSSSGVSSRMWVRIPAVTLVSLSKTLNHNCFSPPRG